ncbi:hypothetical protein MKW92_029932 [Papaver armeniacum]|nr:hypothetical protein MKW92_029932 [Papaver armeniacum]
MESSRKLFSNCPILEELRLSSRRILERLSIVNPTLKHLVIPSCYLTQSTVEISAPNLLTISYTEYPPENCILNSFLSLVEADVGFYMYEGYKYPNKVFLKVLEKLSSAKLLKIYANSFLVCLIL